MSLEMRTSSTRKRRWVHANRCSPESAHFYIRTAPRALLFAKCSAQGWWGWVGGLGGTAHITGQGIRMCKSVPRVSIAMHGVPCGLFLQIPEKLRDGMGGFKDRNNRRRFSLPATARYLDLKKSATQDSRRSSLASVCSTTCNASLVLSFSTYCTLVFLTTTNSPLESSSSSFFIRTWDGRYICYKSHNS